jgi:hypothetical protein
VCSLFFDGTHNEKSPAIMPSRRLTLDQSLQTEAAARVEPRSNSCPARTLRLHLLLALQDGTNSVPPSCHARPAPLARGFFSRHLIDWHRLKSTARTAPNLLTRDEARRIAANIAKAAGASETFALIAPNSITCNAARCGADRLFIRRHRRAI